MEIWKKSHICEYIEVSNIGRVRSVTHKTTDAKGRNRVFIGQIIKPFITHQGYVHIRTSTERKKIGISVHRLLMKAFHPVDDKKLQVNHKNGIKTDNRIENLEWVTAKENMIHSFTILGREVNSNVRNAVIKRNSGKFGIENSNHISVTCFDINGKEIRTYGSMSDAKKDGFNVTNISLCVSGKQKTHKGFVFRDSNP